MTPLAGVLMVFCLVAMLLHTATTVAAGYRCRQRREAMPAPNGAPAVTILRPVWCGPTLG